MILALLRTVRQACVYYWELNGGEHFVGFCPETTVAPHFSFSLADKIRTACIKECGGVCQPCEHTIGKGLPYCQFPALVSFLP